MGHHRSESANWNVPDRPKPVTTTGTIQKSARELKINHAQEQRERLGSAVFADAARG
jgi:hypothetical protein